jgi:hypothetical protein
MRAAAFNRDWFEPDCHTSSVRRLTPYFLLASLVFGMGAAVGLGLSEAPPSRSVRHFFPAVPNGWKAVTYRGVVLDVPRSWVVSTWKYPCGVTGPTVLLGPEPTAFMKYFCPLYPQDQRAAEVNIGARPIPGATRETVINGNRVAISFTTTQQIYGRVETAVDQVILHVRTVWIRIEIGTSALLPGGGPGRAMQIVRTIHLG